MKDKYHVIKIPDDLHKVLKIKAAENGTRMTTLAEKYIREGLKSQERKKWLC